MNISLNREDIKNIASQIIQDIQSLTIKNTPFMRKIRRKYSRKLKEEAPLFILDLARELLKKPGYPWIAYELILYHKPAFLSITEEVVEEFGQGINSWWTVDSFARTLSGPAWLKGLVPDELIHKWAHSSDLWWRRAALVSTVALNKRSHGGYGDVPRTLAVCCLLADDHEDMVVKALSWALRELVVHDRFAVEGFLKEHGDVLAARVKREVGNKLRTGVKNPKK